MKDKEGFYEGCLLFTECGMWKKFFIGYHLLAEKGAYNKYMQVIEVNKRKTGVGKTTGDCEGHLKYAQEVQVWIHG